ncbi:esterase family protein [[Mycobacterium] zoologicum]|uniref:esterase family protein n=1 Tax=[Mycobacterium] zoologicum TaxID=2872311 RepID=UPI001CDADC28|nr:alpha/beta hydrolase family protein [Mycolicibacter sp. MYC101]MEB3061909.1 alpha/beta hydrolase family protein [Mycolicibacter sp. MYC101]
MRNLLNLLQPLLSAVLTLGLISATTVVGAGGTAHASHETLMVPSAAMGRDIPVAFLPGGPHTVYLLDAFDASPDVSNWVTAGNAMNTLAGKGVSVAAPAGGAYSMYADWERDGSKQWNTFLSSELPDWLAANKGLAPGGHAVVGASQGGYAAVALAAFHPERFRYAGSMSGFLYPSETAMSGAINNGLSNFGGVNSDDMWGMPQLGRWKWHDPYAHAALLAQNNTRLWVFSPQTLTASNPAAMLGVADLAQSTNKMFYAQYRGVSGSNGHFDFPVSGDHGWSTWGPQLSAMSGDMTRAIR